MAREKMPCKILYPKELEVKIFIRKELHETPTPDPAEIGSESL